MDADLTDLLAAWTGDEAADGRRDALLDRLRTDPEFRAAAVDELRTLAMLKVLRSGEPRWLRLEDELGWSADECADDFADGVAAEVAALPLPERPAEPSAAPPAPPRRPRRGLLAVAASLLLAAGAALGYGLTRPAPDPLPAQPSGDAVALLVRMDGPGWVAGNGPAVGDVVGTGALALGGGSATLALFNGATLHVEGPAEVDLRAADRVFCRRGKVRVDAPSEATGFTAQAPGATVTNPTAEFALTVGDDAQVHVAVFEGRADVTALDGGGQATGHEALTGGQTVRVDPRGGRITAADRVPQTFAGPIPALDPPLRLDPTYPAAVRGDGPFAYWRFETAEGGRTPNEIPGGPALKLIGRAVPVASPGAGHRGLHFPPPTEWDQHGALAEGPWTPKHHDYAVECWVMPRAVRPSAVVGLVGEADASRLESYGVLIELTGQPALYHHPVRSIRGLHRLPVGRARGSNQFSPTQYVPYRWYHVVAQRSGDRAELYVDGELAAVGPMDGSPLPQCRVLLGALYASRDGRSCFERPFVGTLDEVAVYGRALPPAAIRRHFQLGRGAPK